MVEMTIVIIKPSLHAQRGQTLPVWAFGSLSVLVMLVMVLDYGGALRWQIRAQNAADAAARGLLAAQTVQWNETTSVLHAAAIEEYRIRYLVRDIDEVVNDAGGCVPLPDTAPDPQSCDQMYINLRGQYLDAVQRYTNDVLILNRVSANGQAAQITQIQNALAQYQANCGSTSGGDCAFKYTLVAAKPRNDNYVEDVYADCCAFVVGGGTNGHPKTDLEPLEVEIVACATVNSLIPSFFTFKAPTFMAIGRAAATSIQSTQEFEYTGSIVNPTTGNVFQGSEFPETTTGTPAFPTNDPNYRIDYGGNPDNPYNQGNPASSDGKYGFTYVPSDQGLLVATGWWSAMPIKPFSGGLNMGVIGCN